MSIKFSSEQQELASSFRKFLTQEESAERRRKIVEGVEPRGTFWPKAVEFGLPALFGQDDKDAAGIRELALFAFESGRQLPSEPLIESTFAGSLLFGRLLSAAERQRISKLLPAQSLNAIVDGASRVALAPFTFARPLSITARGQGELRRIDACVDKVAQAEGAEFLVFCAAVAGAKPELLLADFRQGKEQRIVFEPEATLDLSRAYSTLNLANVATVALGSISIDQLARHFELLMANELAGICAQVVSMTVEYVKTRTQFGAAIGSFQAVQHRLADMHVQAEAMRTLASFAAWAAQASPEQALLTADAAIGFAAEQGPQIVEGAIQLHGGIGFTWEYDLHLYLRRARMIEACCGGIDKRAERILESVAKSA